MSAPTYAGWITGDPDTVERVRGLLDAGKRTTREAVATQQKRWGDSPTGALSMAQFARLMAEHAPEPDPTTTPPPETTTPPETTPAPDGPRRKGPKP